MNISKNIFMTLGDASDGKTTVSRAVVEATSLLGRPCAGLIDADEKVGFSKMSDSVRQMDVRNFDDFAAVELLLAKFDFLWTDMPGTAKQFLREAVSDPAGLANLGILITPVLLVGARGSSMEEAEAYLQQMAGLPRIFIVHNPKKVISDSQRGLFEAKFKNKKLSGPPSRTIIHLPPLESSIAKELERLGFPIADIVEGKVPPTQSELLSLTSTRVRLAKWKKDLFSALEPLTDAVKITFGDSVIPIPSSTP